jgi:hypothetical protein
LRFVLAALFASILLVGSSEGSGAGGKSPPSSQQSSHGATADLYSLSRADTVDILEAVFREFFGSEHASSAEVYLAWGWGDDWTLVPPPPGFLERLAPLNVRLYSISELGEVTGDDLRGARIEVPPRLVDPATGRMVRIVYPTRLDVLGKRGVAVRMHRWGSSTIPGWLVSRNGDKWEVVYPLWPIIVCNI